MIKTLEDNKKQLSLSDTEDITDAYQKRVEKNWALSDLYDEMDSLDEHEEPDNIIEEDTFYIQ